MKGQREVADWAVLCNFRFLWYIDGFSFGRRWRLGQQAVDGVRMFCCEVVMTAVLQCDSIAVWLLIDRCTRATRVQRDRSHHHSADFVNPRWNAVRIQPFRLSRVLFVSLVELFFLLRLNSLSNVKRPSAIHPPPDCSRTTLSCLAPLN